MSPPDIALDLDLDLDRSSRAPALFADAGGGGGEVAPQDVPRAAEEVDPELAGLPDPPKGERRLTFVLLFVTACASMAMAIALGRDAAYAFAPARPVDVGDLRTAATDRAPFADNVFAEGRGMVGAAGAIRYERAFGSGSYRLMPVVGRSDVWVETRLAPGEESGRYVPPSVFVGRLVRFDVAGPRHRGLARAIAEETGVRLPEHAWLIVDGEEPAGARWAVALVALFAAFAAWNALSLVKLARRVRR